MSLSQSYRHLASSPLDRALQHYIQNGMAPNFLGRLTLRLCYWYQSMTGRQTATLDARIYRRTRTTLEEFRHAYIIWQRHRYPCRCGCEINNTDFRAFSLAVNRLQDWGWLGESGEDDSSTEGTDTDEILAEIERHYAERRSRASPDSLRRGREQVLAYRSIFRNSSTDESARSPPPERSANENHPGLVPSRYSGDPLMSRRRGEASNSRSRSSPPDPSTEQRNSPDGFWEVWGRFAHRASNARGNSRNISTTSLMNRIMGRSNARSSSNISRGTSRRSRGSSMNGRGMRRPPNLATAQRTGGNPFAPSTIDTRTRSGSLGSSMADRESMPILPPIDIRRLYERLTMLSETERSSISARANDLLSELRARPANSYGEMVDRWRSAASLMNQITSMGRTTPWSIVHGGEGS